MQVPIPSQRRMALEGTELSLYQPWPTDNQEACSRVVLSCYIATSWKVICKEHVWPDSQYVTREGKTVEPCVVEQYSTVKISE